MSDTITLPEITIVGDPDMQPQNATDWWCEGFMTGYNKPDATPDRPLMINDALASAFSFGVASGQASAAEVQAELEAEIGPQQELTTELRGKSLEKAEAQFRRQLEQFFEKEMPHTESESESQAPPPLPTIGLVE
jgi:hypothetical protein